jgi:uncharacterized membrane protein
MVTLVIYLCTVILALLSLLIVDYLDEEKPTKEDFILVTLLVFAPLINLLIIGASTLEIIKTLYSQQKEKFTQEIIEKVNSSKRKR